MLVQNTAPTNAPFSRVYARLCAHIVVHVRVRVLVRVGVGVCVFLDVCTFVRACSLSDWVYLYVFLFMQKGHTSQSIVELPFWESGNVWSSKAFLLNHIDYVSLNPNPWDCNAPSLRNSWEPQKSKMAAVILINYKMCLSTSC